METLSHIQYTLVSTNTRGLSKFVRITVFVLTRVYGLSRANFIRQTLLYVMLHCTLNLCYLGFDNEVSPYYLRLADGLLNLDREKSSSDTSSWLRRTERTSTPSQDQIRTNSLRKQACQGRRMDFSFESGLSSKMQQQLDEMLQQSADLISSLNQKQGRDEHDQEQGVGEDLDKISKILMTIGAAIKTNESS